ncbi:MAG: flagellar export chaperone FlgN [Spirochaetia bacterium]|nr:flagellar export chaperone FlgN [Spirochaetia bacterium]
MDKHIHSNDLVEINNLCEKLIQIFQDEEGLYLELIKKEDLKKAAILERNTENLLKISREQEDSLKMVDLREKERTDIIRQISQFYRPAINFEKISEIADLPRLPYHMKEKLLHHSYALRELMFTLKNITNINQEMLEDNKRLFDSLIEELIDDRDNTYGPAARNKQSSGPLFINLNG